MVGARNSLHASVIDTVLSAVPDALECQVHALSNDGEAVYRQGVVQVPALPSVNVVFSLPSQESERVFVLASDGNVMFLRTLVANLQEMLATTTIELGQVLLLSDDELKQRKVAGVIFLPVSVSNLLQGLPEVINVDDRSYRFLLVVLITEIEHKLWLERGHNELMEYFEEIEKDVVSMPPLMPIA